MLHAHTHMTIMFCRADHEGGRVPSRLLLFKILKGISEYVHTASDVTHVSSPSRWVLKLRHLTYRVLRLACSADHAGGRDPCKKLSDRSLRKTAWSQDKRLNKHSLLLATNRNPNTEGQQVPCLNPDLDNHGAYAFVPTQSSCWCQAMVIHTSENAWSTKSSFQQKSETERLDCTTWWSSESHDGVQRAHMAVAQTNRFDLKNVHVTTPHRTHILGAAKSPILVASQFW